MKHTAVGEVIPICLYGFVNLDINMLKATIIKGELNTSPTYFLEILENVTQQTSAGHVRVFYEPEYLELNNEKLEYELSWVPKTYLSISE